MIQIEKKELEKRIRKHNFYAPDRDYFHALVDYIAIHGKIEHDSIPVSKNTFLESLCTEILIRTEEQMLRTRLDQFCQLIECLEGISHENVKDLGEKN